jgi:hypothetical protein
MLEGAISCRFIEEPSILEIKPEAAMMLALERAFVAMFRRSEATAWLPVRLAQNETEAAWVKNAWQRAIASNEIEHSPPALDCLPLPGEGSMADRIINLFDEDPMLPAVLVVSMVAPPVCGAFMFLLARPGLDALEIGRTHSGEWETSSAPDPYLPYWARDTARDTGAPQWKSIPPPLRPRFLEGCRPFATLHRSVDITKSISERKRVLAQKIRDAVLESFVRAGLRDAPSGGTGPEAMEAPEIGWLVHDCPDNIRFATLTLALVHCGSELDPIADFSKLQHEFGKVGTAREALMLAVALIRATQLEKPVMWVEFGEDEKICLGVSKPCDYRMPDEMEKGA